MKYWTHDAKICIASIFLALEKEFSIGKTYTEICAYEMLTLSGHKVTFECLSVWKEVSAVMEYL